MTSPTFAESRFGLGPRGDDGTVSIGDPRSWAVAQIARFQPAIANLPSRAAIATELADFYELRRTAKADARQESPPSVAMMSKAAMPKAAVDPAIKAARREARDGYARLVGARLASALSTPTPFLERITHFWANHFAVSAQKVTTVGFAGLLEMEAVRPHVTGRFGDMLLAAEQHPAMLFYLDQAQSIGPNSALGQRAAARGANRGLNENLAREILELHTLGVRTGYDQADVTEFARALTGWTVAGVGRGPGARFVTGNPGDFSFVDALHEPGARTILGRRFAEGGEGQARAVLEMLAVHPATARHVATKLSRHFAADDPPPAMVARLERAFLSSGGDLPTVYRALIASPEAWDETQPKFRSPWDWTVASLRAVGTREVQPLPAVALLNQLGQPVWMPPSPAGWDDDAASWAGPDALVRRVEAAQRIAERANAVDARSLAPVLLGAQLAPATATAIARAESPTTGLALLLASPEMLRR
ncbi:MAG: DUF1800 domain-containing protein [Sphingomicrobium sp.]